MMSKIQELLDRDETNEYGYRPHKKKTPFLHKNNPWLYVFIVAGGLVLSYLIVQLTI